MATDNIVKVECVLASWCWYINYGIQGCRIEIRPFRAAPMSRSADKGHIKVKNSPKHNYIIKYHFLSFCLGDKFNGNIIFDICQGELLQVNVTVICVSKSAIRANATHL